MCTCTKQIWMEFQIDLWNTYVNMERKGYKRASLPVGLHWDHLYWRMFTFLVSCLSQYVYKKPRHYCGRVAAGRPFGQLECIVHSRTVCHGIPLKWLVASHASLANCTTSVCWVALHGRQDCCCFVAFNFKNHHWHHAFFRPEPFSRLYLFGTKGEKKRANPPPAPLS